MSLKETFSFLGDTDGEASEVVELINEHVERASGYDSFDDMRELADDDSILDDTRWRSRYVDGPKSVTLIPGPFGQQAPCSGRG